MKIRTIEQIENTDRDVQGDGFRSLRLILAKDNMGFSLHKTIIPKGEPKHWHYKEHLEACYCVSGTGLITDLITKEEFLIMPDTIYILDSHDDHTFQAFEDTILISVFNPPVTGAEIHNKDGSYEIVNNGHKNFIHTSFNYEK